MHFPPGPISMGDHLPRPDVALQDLTLAPPGLRSRAGLSRVRGLPRQPDRHVDRIWERAGV